MPGIFGVIEHGEVSARTQRELEIQGAQMAIAMKYDASYSCVTASSPSMGAFVGRVSLLDAGSAAFAATAPVSGLIVLTTGEDVETPATRENTSLAGPAAVRLTELYLQKGYEGLASLAGIHAGVVVDRHAGRCLLFNDRYGRERIFLHHCGGRLFFASEAKGILAAVPKTRRFDTTGLAEMFACGCTLGTQSLFHGIEVLSAGTALLIDGPDIRRMRYFDPQALELRQSTSDREFLEGFPKALGKAVNETVQRGPRVAISLTGGLDSRMVMAVLDTSSSNVPTYTFGSMYRTSGDVRVARRVAKACGQPHQVIALDERFLGAFPETFEAAVQISDGYLGLSAAAELHVNRLARAIAPARMTGNWGGEVMRGVRAFKCVLPKGGFVAPEFEASLQAVDSTMRAAPTHPISAALFQQMPLQGYGRNAIERSQLVMRHPFLSDEVIDWLYRAPAHVRAANSTAAHVVGARPGLLAIRTERGLMGTRDSTWLRAAKEALIKAEYMTSHGAPHWMARLGAMLPEGLVDRRFLGVDKFQHFRYWTRRQLASFVRDTLVRRHHPALDGWVDMRRVHAMVDDHVDGRANYIDEIDKLLTLTVLQDSFLIQPRRQAA